VESEFDGPLVALPGRALASTAFPGCFVKHAARTLPPVQRRPLTLLALGLEEPFPFRPTSDALCRHTGTVATAPTIAPATDSVSTGPKQASNQHPHCRLTAAARTALAPLGLGEALLTAQNVSNRTGAN
jgi:hypothetical protein